MVTLFDANPALSEGSRQVPESDGYPYCSFSLSSCKIDAWCCHSGWPCGSSGFASRCMYSTVTSGLHIVFPLSCCLQALKAAANLAEWSQGKVTVVVVDDKGTDQEQHTAQKLTTINSYLAEAGCSNFQVMEKLTSANHSALVGDVAEDLKADMVVLSTDNVHEHKVDANLLAEFVPCSVLLLP
mmetsp:Transcript_16238/g.45242  ORF Transcript_16238/g.45242 Transcript_16238/m.45242 type:complete len:184 (-) Transcript_16238:256-807(-)